MELERASREKALQASKGRLAASRSDLQDVERALKTPEVPKRHTPNCYPCFCYNAFSTRIALMLTCLVLTYTHMSSVGPGLTASHAAQDGGEDMDLGEHSERGNPTDGERAKKRSVLVVPSESDEEDAPEEALQPCRAELDALEEELAAEEDRLQVHLASLHIHGYICFRIWACPNEYPGWQHIVLAGVVDS